MDLTKTSAIMTIGVERLAQDVADMGLLIGLDSWLLWAQSAPPVPRGRDYHTAYD